MYHHQINRYSHFSFLRSQCQCHNNNVRFNFEIEGSWPSIEMSPLDFVLVLPILWFFMVFQNLANLQVFNTIVDSTRRHWVFVIFLSHLQVYHCTTKWRRTSWRVWQRRGMDEISWSTWLIPQGTLISPQRSQPHCVSLMVPLLWWIAWKVSVYRLRLSWDR